MAVKVKKQPHWYCCICKTEWKGEGSMCYKCKTTEHTSIRNQHDAPHWGYCVEYVEKIGNAKTTFAGKMQCWTQDALQKYLTIKYERLATKVNSMSIWELTDTEHSTNYSAFPIKQVDTAPTLETEKKVSGFSVLTCFTKELFDVKNHATASEFSAFYKAFPKEE